jgi:hypothetical protein
LYERLLSRDLIYQLAASSANVSAPVAQGEHIVVDANDTPGF